MMTAKVIVVSELDWVRCKKCGGASVVKSLRSDEPQPIQKIGGIGTVMDYRRYCSCCKIDKDALVFFDGNSGKYFVNEEFAERAQ